MNHTNACKCLRNAANGSLIAYKKFRDKWDNHIYLTIAYMLPEAEYKENDIPETYKGQPYHMQFNDDGEYLGGSFDLHPEFLKGNDWKLLKAAKIGDATRFAIPFKTNKIKQSVFYLS